MNDTRRMGSRAWYALLLIPVVALLATPIYAKATPKLFGFPFFYWYQFAWVPLTAAIVYFVYTQTRTVGPAPEDGRGYHERVPFTPGPGGRRAETGSTEASR